MKQEEQPQGRRLVDMQGGPGALACLAAYHHQAGSNGSFWGMNGCSVHSRPGHSGSVSGGDQGRGHGSDGSGQAGSGGGGVQGMGDKGGAGPGSSAPNGVQARAMALQRWRSKRENLRFSSAVRYENRKAMAQTRMRIKGQFAKSVDTEDGFGGAAAAAAAAAAAGNASTLAQCSSLAGQCSPSKESVDPGVEQDDEREGMEEDSSPPTRGDASVLHATKHSLPPAHEHEERRQAMEVAAEVQEKGQVATSCGAQASSGSKRDREFARSGAKAHLELPAAKLQRTGDKSRQGRASSCSPASPTTARAADVPDQALLPALKSTPSSMAAMHGGGGDQAPAPSNAAVIADTAMAETSGPGNGRQSMCSGPTNKNGSDSGSNSPDENGVCGVQHSLLKGEGSQHMLQDQTARQAAVAAVDGAAKELAA